MIIRAGDPRIAIDYRNLGNVTAMHLKMMRRMHINGAEVTSATEFTEPGILSPGVPHVVYIRVPPSAYTQILDGRLSLAVQIAVTYTNPRLQPLCYMATYNYDASEQNFDTAGGTLDCGAQRGVWPVSLK
jgi:hypothetical protein